MNGSHGDVARDFEADVFGFGKQFVVEQFLVAFEIGVGALQVCHRSNFGRERGLEAGLGLVQGSLVKVRLDLQQQVALVNEHPFFDAHLGDFAADFRADVNLQHRINAAIRHDGFGDVVARNFFRGHGNGGVSFAKRKIQRHAQRHEDERDDDEKFLATLALGLGRGRGRIQNWGCFHRARLPNVARLVERGSGLAVTY